LTVENKSNSVFASHNRERMPATTTGCSDENKDQIPVDSLASYSSEKDYLPSSQEVLKARRLGPKSATRKGGLNKGRPPRLSRQTRIESSGRKKMHSDCIPIIKGKILMKDVKILN